MNRAYALLIPFAIALTACPPGKVGDTCQTDTDCDQGLVCDKATSATSNADGACAESVVAPTTPSGTT